MNEIITIVKNDYRGIEVWRYQGKIVKISPAGLIAEAFFNRPDLKLNDDVLLKKKDRFLELYLFEKWFNIYEIYDRDNGLLKAWYCNITHPMRMDKNMLYYDDLALDLLVYSDGRQVVLDEEEFKALSLSEDEKFKARGALDELIKLFEMNNPLDIKRLI